LRNEIEKARLRRAASEERIYSATAIDFSREYESAFYSSALRFDRMGGELVASRIGANFVMRGWAAELGGL
jgi:hypothetical protein